MYKSYLKAESRRSKYSVHVDSDVISLHMLVKATLHLSDARGLSHLGIFQKEFSKRNFPRSLTMFSSQQHCKHCYPCHWLEAYEENKKGCDLNNIFLASCTSVCHKYSFTSTVNLHPAQPKEHVVIGRLFLFLKQRFLFTSQTETDLWECATGYGLSPNHL